MADESEYLRSVVIGEPPHQNPGGGIVRRGKGQVGSLSHGRRNKRGRPKPSVEERPAEEANKVIIARRVGNCRETETLQAGTDWFITRFSKTALAVPIEMRAAKPQAVP